MSKLIDKILLESNLLKKEEQYLILFLWGNKLYMEYNNLPSGPGGFPNLDFSVKYMLKHPEDENVEDMIEWMLEGGKYKSGKCCITKNYVDKILYSCMKPLEKDTTFYRYNDNDRTEWVSITSDRHGYSGHEFEVIMPKGEKVINTLKFADNNEFIIRKEQLKKYYKPTGKINFFVSGIGSIRRDESGIYYDNKNKKITDNSKLQAINKEFNSIIGSPGHAETRFNA